MSDKIKNYLDDVFAPYDSVRTVAELKEDLLSDLTERFAELKSEGKDDQAAFDLTVESIGEIEETVLEMANLTHTLERQVLPSFKAGDLKQSDLAGVRLHKGEFNSSALQGSDFSNSDLTGSSFSSSDVHGTNFDGANLTDCNFSVAALEDSTFRKSILFRTNFTASGLDGVTISDARLVDVKLSKNDLRKVNFQRCAFEGVDFRYCDMRKMSFDNMTFIGVRFDKSDVTGMSFHGAVLRNVSFGSSMMSRKFFKMLKTICFEGAKMDKPTYAVLKGCGVDLIEVTVI